MYELRPYQQDSVEAGLRTLRMFKRDILVEPTGSGKSLIIASVAKELEGDTIVFQPNKEILEQNLQKMHDFGFTDVGVFSASMGEKTLGKVTFATIGTIYNQKDMWHLFDNVIIDECHLVNAKGGMYDEFIKAHGGAVLGLTATPYRLHSYNDFKTDERAVVAKMLNRTKPKIFDGIAHITQIREMYDMGFLAPVRHSVASNYDHAQLTLNSTGMDFTDASLRAYNEENDVVGEVAKLTASTIKDGAKHVLIFNKFVEEAEALSSNLQNMGIVAESISAETPRKQRKQILEDFRSGKIQVVTNVGVLTTGFDFPELDCVILARPTQSVALYYQMVGRGVRTAEGKECLHLIDVCGNVKRFGTIDTFELVPVSEGSKLLRLKSDVSFLTGYDFVGNQDLEERDYAGYREGNGKNPDIIFIGKWSNGGKGTHVSKIDSGYMEWAVDNFNSGSVKAQFTKELERRKQNDQNRDKTTVSQPSMERDTL